MKKKLLTGLAVGVLVFSYVQQANADTLTLNSNLPEQNMSGGLWSRTYSGSFNLDQLIRNLGKQDALYTVNSGVAEFKFYGTPSTFLANTTYSDYYLTGHSGDNYWYQRDKIEYYLDNVERANVNFSGEPSVNFRTTQVNSGPLSVGNTSDGAQQYCVFDSPWGLGCLDTGYRNYSTNNYINNNLANGNFGGTISLGDPSLNKLNDLGVLNFSIAAPSSNAFIFKDAALSLDVSFNYAPENLSIISTDVYEGSTVEASMKATDKDPDSLTFTINGNNAGTISGAANSERTSNTVNLAPYFDNDGATKTADITGTVTDGVGGGIGGNSSTSKTINIINVTPDATMHLSNTTIYEGESISAWMTATDPGNDYLDFTIAGQDAGIGVGGNLAGSTRTSNTINLGQFFEHGGTNTVSVDGSVIDDGTVRDYASAIFTVLNLDPIIDDVTYSLSGRNFLNFGATAHDPGLDTLTYSWDLDGNGSYDYFGSAGTWEYLTAGLFSVGLQVADGDGGFGYRNFDINIAAATSGNAPVPEPATMLLMGTGLAGLVGARRKKK